jgi:hypothetical protein
MLNLTTLAEGINPSGIFTFVDVAQVWLKQPLSHARRTWVESQCGPGGMHVKDGLAWFDRSLTQRLQLKQPTREVLQSLGTLDGTVLNYAELSVDWIFDQEEDRDEAYEFLCGYHFKKCHRNQGIRFVGNGLTRYTGPRKAPNVLVIYRDRPSKVTGDLFSVHCDWRMKGTAALHRAGIASVTDLITLDYREFWRERLLLRAIDPRDLGRMYRIYVEGKGRRRGPWIIFSGQREFAYQVDLRAGATIIRALGSTQAVLDYYRKLDLNRCLREIDVRHLLPRDISL